MQVQGTPGSHTPLLSQTKSSTEEPVFGDSGFLTQLLSTMRRQLLQKLRMRSTTALEMLLPVVFVIGLLAIASISSRTNEPAEQFVSATGPLQFGSEVRTNLLCYNATTANADLASLLPPCNNTAQCLPRSLAVPIDGLCMSKGPNAIMWLASTLVNDEQDIEVPNYNEYLLFKWAAASLLGDSSSLDDAYQPGSMYITPQDYPSQAFTDYMNTTFSLFKYSFGGFFGSRDDAIPFVKDVTNEGKVWAVISFQQLNDQGLNYVLSMNQTAQATSGVRNRFVKGLGDKTYAAYLASGALSVQKAVNDYYMNRILNTTIPNATTPVGAASRTILSPMPVSKHVDDEFLDIGGQLSPFLLVLAFLYPVSQLAKRLVEEKEQRLREGTMIMGLGKGAFFASWLIVYYVQMFIVSLMVAILLKAGITKQSDFFIIWVPYLLFALTSVNLSALLSTFFSRAKIAALCVPLIYFVFAIPAFAIPATASPALLKLLSLLCPVPISMALKLIFSYEINNGMGWNDATSTTDEPYNLALALFYFVVDFVLYLVLMFYFDMIVPKDWGTTKHPCFCCCCCCSKNADDDDEEGGMTRHVGELDNPRNHLPNVGKEHALQDYPLPNSKSSIHIRGLRKEFPGANGRINVAVDGMELRMFPDGITCFLGHNGAGKTTVMNMMTGMMSPTKGDVTIYGNSILSNMQSIRRDIGFCPQHNILWDDLTCMEHLQYFARLKGMTGAAVDEEALEMLTKVDLLDKKDVYSVNLSGGQKRKLSVAIAFMGRAKLVLLDEPTAGMDVAARRHTWDVLKDMSKGRTILLTTHFMDEADLLGSRIAIMSKGSLHSYGTPMFLKNTLGSGYVMRIGSASLITDPQAILTEVQRIIPKASIREAKGQELAISLPKDDARLFPQAIRTMDSAAVRSKLGIVSVSLSVASLEDVFLAIAHQEDLHGLTEEEYATEGPAKMAAAFDSLEKVYVRLQEQQESGKRAPDNFTRQLHGMLMKRLNHSRRDYTALALQILAPIVCLVIAMLMGKLGASAPSETYYDNSMYGSVSQIMSANNCSNAYWDPDFASIDQLALPTTFAFSENLLSTFSDNGNRERMVSFSCNDTFGNAVLFANATGTLTAPQALHQYYRNLARQVNPAAVIDTAQWPLPFTERQQSDNNAISALLVAEFVLIPFTFIPATFVAFVVRERECKSKHLQFVSGASYTAYWLANFLFDLTSYLATVGITFIMFFAFSQDWAIGSAGTGFGAFMVFLLYGLSVIGFAYLVSFLFTVHSTAQTVVMMVNFLVGFLLVMVMYFLQNIDSTKSAAKVIVFFLRLIPPFALGDSIFAMVMANAFSAIEGKKSPFEMDVAGWNMLYMGLLSAVFLIITMFIDHPSRQKRREMLSFKHTHAAPPVADEDEDVLQERNEVESGQRPKDVVQVQGLRKEFSLGGGKKKVAVQNITFGVKKGEVFGFLGTNGAGKTTTMSMLTTEILPTCGHGRVGGFDIVQHSDKTRRLIGYCPQFDAIMDLLTPAEHLKLFAALRGIPMTDTSEVIEALINSCALEKYRDIPAGKLSGGNKRKLSVAMALIGGPSIVFLDEPSAGMDPHARRLLWDVIIFVAKHSSVVLTTHHLEEVDVLAHRVGIMDQGLMKCLGSLEHLKLKFGSGFELTVQVSENGQKSATDFVLKKYPAATLVEARQQRMLFTLPFESTDLAGLFETIQEATDSADLGIIDYTVQQTSLEQVFLRISGEGQSTDEQPKALTAPPSMRASRTKREDATNPQFSQICAGQTL